MKVAGGWRYLYRAVAQFGQVIDVLASPNRDSKAARRFFLRALAGLQRAAAEIHEDDEAERCAHFLRQLDPAWPPSELR